jgi:hypothetical protein
VVAVVLAAVAPSSPGVSPLAHGASPGVYPLSPGAFLGVPIAYVHACTPWYLPYAALSTSRQ